MKKKLIYLSIAVSIFLIAATYIPEMTGYKQKPVINTYSYTSPLFPKGAQIDVLYSGGDSVMRYDEKFFPNKNSFDFLAFIPDAGSTESGTLFVNHELRKSNDHLGDGGGMSWLKVKKENGHWKRVSNIHDISFEKVGGTWHNCGGVVTPYGTLLTAEEWPVSSNAELFANGKHFRDTSDINGMKRFENLGWMVEVNTQTKQVTKKMWSMGRYSHEDAYCASDGRTVYLTDDACPSVFFKFEAENFGSYDKGTLFAYKQSEDGKGGSWIPLPGDMKSLINIREVAISKGATMFAGMEWVDGIDGKIYITETGGGHDYTSDIKRGGTMAYHFKQAPLNKGNNKTEDLYGRILEFDPVTLKMSVLVEGGITPDGGSLGRPDGMTASKIGGKKYLVVCEDGGNEQDPPSAPTKAAGTHYNETYLVDLESEKKDKEKLIRLGVCPEGCEMTGPIFSPDGKTLFITIQHASEKNEGVYKGSSVVLAVTGIFE